MGGIKVSAEGELTVMKVSGSITVQDIIATLEKFYREAPTRLVVWDVREAPEANFSAEDAEHVSTVVSSLPNLQVNRKVAVLAPNDLQFGMARMFGAHTEVKELPFEVAVFRNLAAAELWLGVKIP